MFQASYIIGIILRLLLSNMQFFIILQICQSNKVVLLYHTWYMIVIEGSPSVSHGFLDIKHSIVISRLSCLPSATEAVL